MLIEKIKGLNLQKPIEITVKKFYTIECKDLNLYGSGKTKTEAIADFKFAVVDIFEDFEMANDEDFSNGGKKYKETFLGYFE